ncbi:WD40 repeat-like protein [Pholiota molesta]|nr:WD40 repeat-like protein [Pholiota molesta]
MDHIYDAGPTMPTNELQLHGHTNPNHPPLPSTSTLASETQILYMPIISPPTPAPSPRPAVNNIPLSFQSQYNAIQAPPLPLSSFEMNANNPALRREYLLSIIRSCTPDELFFISQTIGPILKREFSFSLPEELVLHVLLFVDDVKTLLNASLVSKRWRRIARDESIWKAMAVAYDFDDLEEAEEEWRRRQEKALHRSKFGSVKPHRSTHASSTEGSAPSQEEGEPCPLSSLPKPSPSISADAQLPRPQFSYRRFFRDTCIIHTNWRRGGTLLNAHRLPIISPDSGTVTSLALDRRWVVVGLASAMIKVYSARTGLFSGVWGVCLVSQGGYLRGGGAGAAGRAAPAPAGDGDDGRGEETGMGDDEGGSGAYAEGSRNWTQTRRKRRSDGGDADTHATGSGLADTDQTGGGAGPADRRRASSSNGAADDLLRARMAGLNTAHATGDGLHVMPGGPSLAHLVPPAMQRALGLNLFSSSSDASAPPRRRRRHAKQRRTPWQYVDEDEDGGGETPTTESREKPFNNCYSSHGWGQPNPIIVSGGCDKVVRVWDLKSGQCIYVLHGHLSTIRSLRVLNHRPIAVTGSRDATLHVWDVQRGRRLRVLEGHQASVRCLDVFGDKVVSGSYDHTCRLWNIDTGECLHVLQGHFSQIYSVAFDGVRIASGGLDTTVRIWDAQTGQCIALLQGHTALVCQLQLAPTLLATGGADGRVITFSLQTYTAQHRIAAHDSSVTALQVSAAFLVTGGNDGRVRVYETRTGALVRELGGASESVWKVAFGRGVCAVACRRAGKTVVEIWSLGPGGRGAGERGRSAAVSQWLLLGCGRVFVFFGSSFILVML